MIPVHNANWEVFFAGGQAPIMNGAYIVQSSDPATWSQNSESGGAGFVRIWAQDTLPASAP